MKIPFSPIATVIIAVLFLFDGGWSFVYGLVLLAMLAVSVLFTYRAEGWTGVAKFGRARPVGSTGMAVILGGLSVLFGAAIISTSRSLCLGITDGGMPTAEIVTGGLLVVAFVFYVVWLAQCIYLSELSTTKTVDIKTEQR